MVNLYFPSNLKPSEKKKRKKILEEIIFFVHTLGDYIPNYVLLIDTEILSKSSTVNFLKQINIGVMIIVFLFVLLKVTLSSSSPNTSYFLTFFLKN